MLLKLKGRKMKTLKKAIDGLNWLRKTRPVRTMAQTAVALIGTEAVGVTDVDWVGVASASALSGVICLLMIVGSGSEAK